jgi:hypothetical protein
MQNTENAVKPNFDHDLAQFRKGSDASIQLVRESGLAVDLTQWLTIKRYAQQNGLTTQVITNWIARGIIPTDCTMILSELNDIRLVKNQPYR